VQVQGRVRRPTASNSGSFGFLEWGASDSAAPFVPVDTDTDMVVVWWPGQQPAGRKSEGQDGVLGGGGCGATDDSDPRRRCRLSTLVSKSQAATYNILIVYVAGDRRSITVFPCPFPPLKKKLASFYY
jgi:hypothetical protein